jgi:IS6 family transposase
VAVKRQNDFKGRHYLPEIILFCVRWYLKSNLSYQDLSHMMKERGLATDKSCIWRWVQVYSQEINRKARVYLKKTGTSYRVDETYIKVKGQWKYLYRAVDKQGSTLDFLLCAKRDAESASRFFKKMLSAPHTSTPTILSVDKNPAYPKAILKLKSEGKINKSCKLRQVKYLNNVVEQDHRFIKKRVKSKLWFGSFHSARRTIAGYEIMHMIYKGQIKSVPKNNPLTQKLFVNGLFKIGT